MPLNFPDSPSLNQVYTSGSNSWQWDGTVWNALSSALIVSSYGPTGATGATGSFNTTTQTIDFSESVNKISFTITGLNKSDHAYEIANLAGKTAALKNASGTISVSGTVQFAESYWDGGITYGQGETGGAINVLSRSADIIMSPPFGGGYSAEGLLGLTLTVFHDTNIYTRLFGSHITGDGYSAGLTFSGVTFSVTNLAVNHAEDTFVVKTITGQSWVAADSYITCKCLGLTSDDHDAEDAILEGVKFEINNIVAGVGFDIIGHAPEGTYGKYKIKCLGQ
jgi:hypothetical protein